MGSITKCRTKYCRGLTTRNGHSPYCSKCASRRFKERHPLKYAFLKLKYRAKERGHEFGLTYEQFVSFAGSSGWADKKGKTAGSLSIDRIDDTRGYFADNIQALTLSENARKRFVPFFKDKEQEREAIAEAEAKVKEAYGEMPPPTSLLNN